MNQAKLLIFTDSNIYGAEFTNTWQAKGYNLQHLPVLRAENIEFDLQLLSDFDGVVITSSNAICALKKYFKNQHIKIYTISKFLAEKIKAEGYQNIYFEVDGKDANSLKTIFNKHLPKVKLIHLCGERIRNSFSFESANIKAARCYRMVEIKENVEKLPQILATNSNAYAYVSSEQAIEALTVYKIAFEQLIFKSNYLRGFAKEFFKTIQAV